MSWGTCYSGSNNIHMGFPALMSDGRLYANWDAACEMNNTLKTKEGITNNYNYRQYLIKNGSAVMNANAKAACENCCACFENFNKTPRVNDKYIFKSCSDKTVPFGYEHSDLKNIYLSRQDLASRLRAPILTQSQYLANKTPNYN